MSDKCSMFNISISYFDDKEVGERPRQGEEADGGFVVQVWSAPGQNNPLLLAQFEALIRDFLGDELVEIDLRDGRHVQ